MECTSLILWLLLLAVFPKCETRKEQTSNMSLRNHAYCRPKSLVKYKLTVHTLWSRKIFPKMFPTYRPHAQWSTLIGRSHGPEYKMWEVGANATLGMKLFAEQGDYSLLNAKTVQGHGHVLDSFMAPPVNKSVGQTSAVIILDGNHSKLSFTMKIIPSPDWFIGVSSMDLCVHGRWKNKLHADLFPFDAGTDQGLTFTSPNWPNVPAEPISVITSSFPNHSASSFLYHEYKKLPRLAYVDVEILAEYRQRKIFKEVHRQLSTKTYNNIAFDRNSRHNDGTVLYNPEINSQNKNISDIDDDPSKSEQLVQEIQMVSAKESPVIDCQVGEWSVWSACSKSCGFGQQQRYRYVSSYPKKGGANCPRLQQSNVCGSARNCKVTRFSFLEESNIKKAQAKEEVQRKRTTRTKRDLN